jgi:PHD/YefM family antitoxin component YafN of YafNO toxin-antitoxin module
MLSINNSLVSVSELKRSPSSVAQIAKETKNAVYILSNNEKLGVWISPDDYEELIHENQLLQEQAQKRDFEDLRAGIERGIEDVKHGRVMTFAEAKTRYNVK